MNIKPKLWNGSYIKNILFKITELDIRLRILYSNNLKNTEERYEILEDLNANDKFLIERKEYNIENYLLIVQVEKMNLFLVVE